MPSDELFTLCNHAQTIASGLEKEPGAAPAQVAEKLFPRIKSGRAPAPLPRAWEEYTLDDLEKASKAGKFSKRPSELFLRMYSDVLDTLEHDPLNGMCAPSLMGNSGYIPLSMVSLIPDVMRYYKSIIENAEHEVFIATNYWEPSWASHFVTEGLMELSRRHEGKETKPVVKLLFDRGNPKQVIKNHQPVLPAAWAELGIPTEAEIPNLHLEVMNYHRPIMGTFHAKYMVVDRRIAILNSNNIQDRTNLEQLTHLEGPIVDSFYDVALLSWAEAMYPPLPLIVDPSKRRLYAEQTFTDAARRRDEQKAQAASAQPNHPDAQDAAHGKPLTDFSLLNAPEFVPIILHASHDPINIAMACRPPHGTPDHKDTIVPQDAAWLAGMRLAQKSVFIQTPDFNNAAVEPILDACRRGVECTLYVCLGYNDGGEMLPRQGGTNNKVMADMAKTLKVEGKLKYLKAHWYVAKDRERPVDAAAKERNCHVKFMCVDGQVAILGNGNQDTQSWFHSQETNIMIDSHEWCTEFVTALNHNQNTALHGRLNEDGEWRDANGELVTSSGGQGGVLKVAKGLVGAVKRVQGKGGF